MTELKNFINNLSELDIHTIFEGFLKAVSDADTYDDLVEHLDISDEEMFRLRENLQSYMGGNINE